MRATSNHGRLQPREFTLFNGPSQFKEISFQSGREGEAIEAS
jgi:hypothetical protein